ncbi:MAG: LPXTG cell wall anchor domain-containing protein [Anaerolineaceae bacterium]|nr:LPXTG cell wall anchor domain-containing protein [Anaerolineaceae bacterium]
MTDFNDNSFGDFDGGMEDDFNFDSGDDGFDEEIIADISPQRGGSNKNFILGISVIGGIFIISLILMVIFTLVIVPSRNTARLEDAARINAQNTATSMAATNQAVIAMQIESATDTPAPTEIPDEMVTGTAVVAFSSPTAEYTATLEDADIGDEKGAPVADIYRTQTVEALLTQAAGGGDGTPGVVLSGDATLVPTYLPDTGFADQVGIPGLFGLALLMIVVIFLARRMRMSST